MTRGIKEKEPDPRIIYGDIIDHPHHQSPTRPHMSLHDRAAQFAPFAALTGYDDMVSEKARIVEKRIEPGDEILEKLNRKLSLLSGLIRGGSNPTVSITYFIPDPLKAGGRYETATLQLRKIDTVKGKLLLKENDGYGNKMIEIDMKDILEIHGEIVNCLDE